MSLALAMKFHDHIDTIDATRLNWTLKVRVTRMWPTIDDQGNIVRHNMILLDCLDTHIYAIVKPVIWNQINPNVLEGGLYIIRNFRVLAPQGRLRPVNYGKCITFIQSTTMSTIHFDDFVIRLHKFEIVPLSNLEDFIESDDPEWKPRYAAANVVGVLEGLQPIQIRRSRNVDRHVVRFSISDGRISHPVHFFGPMNENTASLYNNEITEPTIIILACVRISRFGEKLHITNLAGSKIYINLQYPDVVVLRQRLAEDQNQTP